MTDPMKIPPDVVEAAAKLSDLRPMRRGGLGTRLMKCSKPGCRCGEDPAARHGPYHTLTRAVGGRTRSRYLTNEQAEVVAREVEAAQEFRERVEAAWQACERWADTELEAVGRPLEETPEKGGSKTRSRRRSRRKPPG